jgi:hypothetical protein
MNIDSSLVWKSIIEMVNDDISFIEGNNKIIDICRNSYNHNDWNDIQNIDYSSVVNDFIQCITPDLKHIENNINGLYFGVTNVELNNGDFSFAIEYGGTNNYDENDKDCNWSDKLNWYSAHYLFSNPLYEVYRIANKEDGLGNDIEWPMGLSISIMGINEMIRIIEKSIKNKTIGVVAGFHDGDMLKLRGINEYGNKRD